MDGAHDHQPFYRRHSTKRSYSTMADSHRTDAASSSLFLPADDHYDNEHSSRRSRLTLPPIRTPMGPVPRFAGDGFDYRRPVMSNVTSAAPQNVIDLTDEDNAEEEDSQGTSAHTAQATAGSSTASRLPRFGRDVIDIVSGEEDMDEQVPPRRDPPSLMQRYLRAPNARAQLRPQYSSLRRPARFNRQPSPPSEMDNELEIVSERAISRPQTMSRQPTPAAPAMQRSVTPYPTGFGEPIDLTNDDDVVHLDTRPRLGGINAVRPGTTAGLGTQSLEEPTYGSVGRIADLFREQRQNMGGRLLQRLGPLLGFDGELHAQQQALEHFRNNHHGHVPHRRHHVHGPNPNGVDVLHHRGPLRHLQFAGTPALPGPMMDYDDVGFDLGLGARPPTPKYSPPPEPERGFTRNPEEDEVVVCPNCGDELAMGEDEVKQQVWVIKGCGHVYCGECAHYRAKKTSKKGKAKVTDRSLPTPFSKCVVESCGKVASKGSMFQVYLGS